MASSLVSATLEASLDIQGQKAQAALLPFALAAFGVCLPVSSGRPATPRAPLDERLLRASPLDGLSYVAVNWLRPGGGRPAKTDGQRPRIVWALRSRRRIRADADRPNAAHAGAGRSHDLCGFPTPGVPASVVAPAARRARAALFARPESADLAQQLASAALALALALLVNRILRGQYALIAEREALLTERTEQAEAARQFARVKADLADSLSDELRDGLTGVAHILAAASLGRSAPSRPQLAAALDGVNDLLAIVGAPETPTLQAPGRRLRILMLEADPLGAATLRAGLEQLGHQVVAANRSGRAVDLARICELDLIVCGEPGAVAALRNLPGEAGRTPLAAVIGSEPSAAETALSAGADALLRRPAAAPAVARAIADALAAASAAQADVTSTSDLKAVEAA